MPEDDPLNEKEFALEPNAAQTVAVFQDSLLKLRRTRPGGKWEKSDARDGDDGAKGAPDPKGGGSKSGEE